MSEAVIIVAGGKGLRMQGRLPKQFLPLAGRPVLFRTLETFHTARPGLRMVLVLPASQADLWERLCEGQGFDLPHEVVAGGAERFHSVQNGLAAIGDAALVGVHDGVRPLVSAATINRCYETAAEKGAAIPVLRPVESLRVLTPGGSKSLLRDDYRLVQTPQVFRADWLRKAYQQAFKPGFTDDASVVEQAGFPVALTEGNRANIKLTTPEDFTMAEAWLQKPE